VSETATPVGLLLSDDLMFTSRITGIGAALELRILSARSPEALAALAQAHAPRCVLLDLSNPGLRVGELMDWLRENCPAMPRVVAYGSHVDVAALQAAREAGCDPVLPRSKFVEDLPRTLAGWMS
jgi:CheY-like chemotaxis protein